MFILPLFVISIATSAVFSALDIKFEPGMITFKLVFIPSCLTPRARDRPSNRKHEILCWDEEVESAIRILDTRFVLRNSSLRIGSVQGIRNYAVRNAIRMVRKSCYQNSSSGFGVLLFGVSYAFRDTMHNILKVHSSQDLCGLSC